MDLGSSVGDLWCGLHVASSDPALQLLPPGVLVEVLFLVVVSQEGRSPWRGEPIGGRR